jgi:hypothetical protein
VVAARENGNEFAGIMKHGECLEYLIVFCLLKKDSFA